MRWSTMHDPSFKRQPLEQTWEHILREHACGDFPAKKMEPANMVAHTYNSRTQEAEVCLGNTGRPYLQDKVKNKAEYVCMYVCV